YLDEAERLCDRVAIVHEGRIVALDRPRTLLAGLGEEVIELRVDGDPDVALAAIRAFGIAGDTAFAVGTTVTVPINGRSARDAVTAINDLGVEAASLTTRRPNLDDVYLQLTGTRIAA